MLETLYKTSTPEAGKSECYELSVKALPGTSPRCYAFREDHGWWDDSTKTFIHHVTTINTVEEGVTFEEAEAVYQKARVNRAQSGFVHSFAPDFSGDRPHVYQLLESGAG
ncbi:MAG: hypothetical protein WB424_14460 [Terracidiphilus sp.]